MRLPLRASLALAGNALLLGGAFACSGDEGTTTADGGAAPLDASAPLDAADAADALEVDAADAAPPHAVYAHTPTTLLRFDADAKSLTVVGRFSCAADGVMDLAVDSAERMFASTSQGLVRIDPATAQCAPVASGVYPSALAFVPKGVLDPNRDVLVGYSYAQYMKIDEVTGQKTPLGALNPNPTQQAFYVANDLVYGPTGNLFVTALNGPVGDALLECDAKTGKVIGIVHANEPAVSLLGLAQWKGAGYAFAASGKVYKLSLKNGAATVIAPALDLGDAGPGDAGDAGDAGPPSFAGAAVSVAAPLQ